MALTVKPLLQQVYFTKHTADGVGSTVLAIPRAGAMFLSNWFGTYGQQGRLWTTFREDCARTSFSHTKITSPKFDGCFCDVFRVVRRWCKVWTVWNGIINVKYLRLRPCAIQL